MSVSLQQIFNATPEQMAQVLYPEKLFFNYTEQQQRDNMDEVLNEYRKVLIQEYSKRGMLDEASAKIVSNRHFYPSMMPQNRTLDQVLGDMYNRGHRLATARGSRSVSPNRNVNNSYTHLLNESRSQTNSMSTFPRSSSLSPSRRSSVSSTNPLNIGTSVSTAGRGHPPASEYFNKTNLTEQEQKYCRAVVHVAAKQSEECLDKKMWGQTDSTGQRCYSPYAIAHRSVPGVGKPECFMDLNLNNLPEDELIAEEHLQHVSTPNALYQKQQSKSKW